MFLLFVHKSVTIGALSVAFAMVTNSTQYSQPRRFAFMAFCVVGLAWFLSAHLEAYRFYLAVLPPLLAILLALCTRHVLLSLGAGVLAGGLVAALSPGIDFTSFLAQTGLNTVGFVQQSLISTTNRQILVFLVFILAAIAIMVAAGGLKGVIAWLEPLAKTRRSALFVTFIMGVLMFIDDYANAVLVGTSMRPVCDKYHISREKLAFIVDSTSAPVSGVAFISTWIGYEVGQIGQVARTMGIPLDGYAVFFDIFRFRFYCIFMLLFVLLNIWLGRDAGPMARAERRASTGREQHEVAASIHTNETCSTRYTGLAAILPISLLLIYFFCGLWYDGHGYTHLQQSLWSLIHFSVWRQIVSDANNNMLILMQAGMVCFFATVICARLIAGMAWHTIFHVAAQGVKNAILPLAILLLAWSLKEACDALHTQQTLISLFQHGLSPNLLPCMTFVVAALTSIATGTSWGTMAIMLPMVMPLGIYADDGYGLLTMLSISAVLDGAIFGDHCSPISDTTVMSAISCQCDLMSHVVTQLPYAVFVAFIALGLGYFALAHHVNLWAAYACAFMSMLLCMLSIGRKLPSRS